MNFSLGSIIIIDLARVISTVLSWLRASLLWISWHQEGSVLGISVSSHMMIPQTLTTMVCDDGLLVSIQGGWR